MNETMISGAWEEMLGVWTLSTGTTVNASRGLSPSDDPPDTDDYLGCDLLCGYDCAAEVTRPGSGSARLTDQEKAEVAIRMARVWCGWAGIMPERVAGRVEAGGDEPKYKFSDRDPGVLRSRLKEMTANRDRLARELSEADAWMHQAIAVLTEARSILGDDDLGDGRRADAAMKEIDSLTKELDRPPSTEASDDEPEEFCEKQARMADEHESANPVAMMSKVNSIIFPQGVKEAINFASPSSDGMRMKFDPGTHALGEPANGVTVELRNVRDEAARERLYANGFVLNGDVLSRRFERKEPVAPYVPPRLTQEHPLRTLREIQDSLPWGKGYSADFNADPRPHKDFEHALIHVAKANGKLISFFKELLEIAEANGKLLSLVDELDHGASVPRDAEKYLGDVVYCALRAANEWPGGKIDLLTVLEARIREKG